MNLIEVDEALAIKTFEEILAEGNKNKVVNTCVIYTNERVNGFLEKQPSCAVGHIYHRLVPKDVWQHNVSQVMPSAGWKLSAKASDYLGQLQALQDAGIAWQAAHEIAKDKNLTSALFSGEDFPVYGNYDTPESYVERIQELVVAKED